jgi:dipeptidyl aminopeptidase/acylaminoacyl peptidase
LQSEPPSLSPDGFQIATESANGTVTLWDARTGRAIRTFRRRASAPPITVWSQVRRAGVNLGGSQVLTNLTGRSISVWDMHEGTEWGTLNHGSIISFTGVSPDGSRILTMGSGQIKVWDTWSGAEVCSFADNRRRISTASFSPDGSRIVTTGGVVPLQRTGRVNRSADGSRIVTTDGDVPRVWDATTGVELFALAGHGSEVKSAAFSPDGTRVVTASEDGTARVWDARPLSAASPVDDVPACGAVPEKPDEPQRPDALSVAETVNVRPLASGATGRAGSYMPQPLQLEADMPASLARARELAAPRFGVITLGTRRSPARVVVALGEPEG